MDVNPDWVNRPLHNYIYKLVKQMIRSRKREKRDVEADVFITIDELIYRLRDDLKNVSDDAILTALMKLEVWELINVDNNGRTLEIRLRSS